MERSALSSSEPELLVSHQRVELKGRAERMQRIVAIIASGVALLVLVALTSNGGECASGARVPNARSRCAREAGGLASQDAGADSGG